jgi:hypothetical protein
MIFGGYLFVPFWPRRIRLVAPDARTVILLPNLDVRIIGMGLPRAVASLTRETLVLMLLQLAHLFRVTFFASLGPGKHRFTGLQFREGIPAIPTVLFEGVGSEKVPRDTVGTHDAKSQQTYSQHLRGHFEEGSHGGLMVV